MFQSVDDKTGESLAVFGYSCKMTVCKFRDSIPRGKGGPVSNSERNESVNSKGIYFPQSQGKGRKLGPEKFTYF